MKHSEVVKLITQKQGKEPSQQELADVLGITRNAVASRVFRDKEYSYSDVEKLGKHYDIDFSQQQFVDELIKDYALTHTRNNNFANLKFFPDVFGSCGGGLFVLSETKERIQVPKQLIESYSTIKEYSVITACGDSMLPFIQDSDLLIVEHLQNGQRIIDNRVYVFRYEDSLFVKRLAKNVNQVIIKSDNPEYDTIKIQGADLDKFQIIGRIVGLMRGM